MKKKIILFVFLTAVITFATAQKLIKQSILKGKEINHVKTLSYTFSTSTATYVDLTNPTSVNNGEIWDDPEYTISLPFEFEMNGTIITSFDYTSVGGMLQATTETAGIYEVIAPFDMDLVDRGTETDESLSPLSYLIEGTAGSRICKIEWKNAGSYNEGAPFTMFVNFQTWLYEGSNIIEFHYGPNSLTDSTMFYDSSTGAIIALATYDETNEQISNANFVTGDASSPTISEEYLEITGTPANGMVYRFVPAGSSVSINENNFKLSFYPNPAQNTLNIDLNSSEAANISIVNLVGQTMKEINVNQIKNKVNISDLSVGMYMIKVTQGGKVYSNKFVVK